jgi:hypothetical protein
MVEAAAFDLHDNFANASVRFGEFTKLKLTGRPRGNELDGLHDSTVTPEGERLKPKIARQML